MKVHLLHLLFNLLFDFLCKDFLTRNICTYLPTFYFLLFIIEYSHFFQRLHNYAPNFFYGLTANDLFLCDYIIEVRVPICDHDKNFYLFLPPLLYDRISTSVSDPN